jgi:hypothetical protein
MAVIQTLLDAHINGFNAQDDELFLSTLGDTAIIIDGIAPYRWLNPNAPTLRARQHMPSYPGFSQSRSRDSPSFGRVPLRTRSRTAMASGRSKPRLGVAHRGLLLCA